MLYTGYTLCNDQLRRIRNLLCKSLPDFRVRSGIHGAGTVIQNQYLGLLKQRYTDVVSVRRTRWNLLVLCRCDTLPAFSPQIHLRRQAGIHAGIPPHWHPHCPSEGSQGSFPRKGHFSVIRPTPDYADCPCHTPARHGRPREPYQMTHHTAGLVLELPVPPRIPTVSPALIFILISCNTDLLPSS